MSKRINILIGIIGCCLALAVLVAIPQHAHARDVYMNQTDIVAAVQPDGSLDVTEKRSVRFSGAYSLIYFNFGELRPGSSIQVTGAQVTGASLNEVPFNPSWRSSGGPGKPAYSYDQREHTLYVFNDWKDVTSTITITYKITGEVVRYNDCAMLYWKYVKENWPVDSKAVHLQIKLPPHATQEATVGDALRFWGHASAQNSGELHFDDSNQTIELSNPRVPHGSWAEVRVMMPASWLSQVQQGDSNYIESSVAQQTIDEEMAWAQQANRKRWLLRLLNIPVIVLALALVGYGLMNYVRYGREPKAAFTDKYWRDVPSAGMETPYGLSKDLHPALVFANDHNGKLSECAFNASVVRLAAKRVLSFTTDEQSGGWALEYHPNTPGVELDEIDQMVLDFLFKNLFNERRTRLTQADIDRAAEDAPDSLLKGYTDWQMVCQSRYEAHQFIEPLSRRKSRVQMMVGGIAGIAGLGGAFLFTKVMLFPFLLLILSSIFLLVSSGFVKASTQVSAELKARSKALKRWLLDFTALGDRPPTDVVIWGYFMTYATLYGISQKVFENIQTTMPELFDDPQMRPITQMMGYGHYGSGEWGVSEFNPLASFEQSFTQAITNATFAMSEDADGGGSGGGFSFGGGGGSGGGGGGGFR